MKVTVQNTSELLRIINKNLAVVGERITQINLNRRNIVNREFEREKNTFLGRIFTPKKESIAEDLFSSFDKEWMQLFREEIHLRKTQEGLYDLRDRVTIIRETLNESVVELELDGDEVTLLRNLSYEDD